MEDKLTFHRYQEVHYIDGPIIEHREWVAVKETPMGWRIKPKGQTGEHGAFNHPGKWVPKTSIKKFAYLTKAEALAGFAARKRRQIAILESRLKDAEFLLETAEKMERDGQAEERGLHASLDPGAGR